MANNSASTARGGIGFVGLLQIVFIVLKLCNVITWSWWAVMLPTIVSTGLGAVSLLAVLIFAVVQAFRETRDL